jgi:hypothetical protein
VSDIQKTIAMLKDGMEEAETKAWDSLSRYKFQMFGYWAAIWVHLNRISGTNAPNPFHELVKLARQRNGDQQ